MAMFESLSKRLEGVFTNLSGKGKLTEADVDEAMREVRLALLEADVSLKLVRQFVERVKAKAGAASHLGSAVWNTGDSVRAAFGCPAPPWAR